MTCHWCWHLYLNHKYFFFISDWIILFRWGGDYDGVLPNLTYFNLAHNKLYNIPATLISSFPMLRTLDLTGNQFIHYYPEFTSNIKSGLDLRWVQLKYFWELKIFMKTQVTRDQCRNSVVKYFNVFRYADNNLRCECSLRPVVNWLRAGKIQCVWYCCDTLYLYLILCCQDFSWYRAPVFDIVNCVCWLSLWEWKLL